MALPIIQSRATSADHSSNPTLNLPSGITAGDLLILILHYDVGTSSGSYFNTPSGWTVSSHERPTGTYLESAVYYKIADGTEGSTLSYSTSGRNGYFSADALRITGHDAVTPINSLGALYYNSNSGTVAAAGTTTTVDECLLIGFAAQNYGTLSALIVSGSTWALLDDVSPVSGSSSVRAAFCAGYQTTAGVTPELDVEFPTSDYSIGWQFSIAPEATVVVLSNAIMFGCNF